MIDDVSKHKSDWIPEQAAELDGLKRKVAAASSKSFAELCLIKLRIAASRKQHTTAHHLTQSSHWQKGVLVC